MPVLVLVLQVLTCRADPPASLVELLVPGLQREQSAIMYRQSRSKRLNKLLGAICTILSSTKVY